MRRRLLVILPGLTTVLGLAIPAHAESGAVKDVFIEDFQGTTALDDPAFTDRLGYEGRYTRTAPRLQPDHPHQRLHGQRHPRRRRRHRHVLDLAAVRGAQSKLAVMTGTLDLMNSSFCICSMGTWIVLPHAVPPGRAVNGRSDNRRPSLVSRRTS